MCTVNIDVGASLACNRYIKHSKSVRSVVCNVLQLTQIDAPATLYTLDLFSMIYKEDRGEEEEKKKQNAANHYIRCSCSFITQSVGICKIIKTLHFGAATCF